MGAMGPIKINKAKCLHCGDVLISEGKYETCSCGKLTIGAGSAVQYRSGEKDVDYKEMSIMNESFFGKINPKETVPKDVPIDGINTPKNK